MGEALSQEGRLWDFSASEKTHHLCKERSLGEYKSGGGLDVCLRRWSLKETLSRAKKIRRKICILGNNLCLSNLYAARLLVPSPSLTLSGFYIFWVQRECGQEEIFFIWWGICREYDKCYGIFCFSPLKKTNKDTWFLIICFIVAWIHCMHLWMGHDTGNCILARKVIFT